METAKKFTRRLSLVRKDAPLIKLAEYQEEQEKQAYPAPSVTRQLAFSHAEGSVGNTSCRCKYPLILKVIAVLFIFAIAAVITYYRNKEDSLDKILYDLWKKKNCTFCVLNINKKQLPHNSAEEW